VAREEDFAFAERVLQRGYATEEQVQECLSLVEQVRELKLEESLANLMVKKGYLATAQAHVLEAELDPDRAGRPKNAIEGYRLLERIGSGAMGSVYKADHLKLLVQVALKVLRPSLASSRTQIERLKREAQLAARLSHPNVVKSLDVGESNGFHYLAMEFVEGETVRDLLARGRVPEKEALGIVRQVASGLAHAHQHGVVHRDVKPGNIMITPEGVAKLADFGLARGQGPSDLTLEHASIGTPQYVAPEQMRRGSDATGRSDLFSLGATLYHMVTGRPPFDGENLGEIVQNVLACRFEPPERLAPELSRDAIYVIDRLMRANPRERYASAADLVLDLERIERGEPIAPPDFLGDYQAFLRKRRGRRSAILAGVAAVLVVTGAFLFVRAQNEAKRGKLMALCQVKDGTRDDVASLESGAELRAALEELRKADADAASAGCPVESIRALRARIAETAIAAGMLSSAEEEARKAASDRDANYRGIDGKLKALKPTFAGVRAKIDKLRAEVRKSSDEAAESRYAGQINNGFRDLETAKQEVRAFATDLETRYLQPGPDSRAGMIPWMGYVAQAPRLLDEFDRRWQGLAKARSDFDAEVEARRYNVAAKLLSSLRADEAAALRPVFENAYLRKSLGNPSEDAKRANKLDDAETHEWSDEVLVTVSDLLEASEPRPDRAEEVLSKFRNRASRTFDDVEKKLKEVTAQREERARLQQIEFAAAEAQCLSWLRERLYWRAYESVSSAAQSGRWLTGVDEQYRQLRDRAQRMTELPERFLARVRKMKKVPIGDNLEVPGDRIERAPGEDKDLFVAHTPKETREFRLRELKRKVLEEILAFGPEDRSRRALFYAGEAYQEDREHPYEAEKLRGEARDNLDMNDPWAAKIAEELEATRERIRKGEARAQQADAELTEAEDRDPVKALALVRELLDTLGWTNYVTPEKRKVYLQKRDRLERLAGRGLFQREVGVPTGQLDYGGTQEPTTITLTGLPWHPDEESVPRDEPNRAARLDQLTLQYWTQWYTEKGMPKEEIDLIIPRARTQLLPWSGPVETLPSGGYRPTDAALVATTAEWFNRTRPEEIDLWFPFRSDQPWSIEFEVRWPREPGCFVVAAGRIQAVVGYQHPETRGGMSGACLLVGEDLDPGAHLKELDDLHWHMVHPPKGEKAPRRPTEGGEKAFLDDTNFVEGEPYLMRLERTKENRIRFTMHPVRGRKGGEEPTIVLEKRDRNASQLDKDTALGDGRKVFRFFGAPGKGLAYELSNVRISGILEQPARAEATKQ